MDEIIDWPERLRRNPYKISFLTGVPYFGPHAKILKNAKSILERRSKKEVERLWSDYYSEIPGENTVEDVYEVAGKYLKWPNNLFVPSDKAGIVFGFIPGIWIDPEDVIEEICEKVGVLDPDAIYKLTESIERDNLLTFFKCLKNIISTFRVDLTYK